jgi:hypothetical protein
MVQEQGHTDYGIQTYILNKNGWSSRSSIFSIVQPTCLPINAAVQLDCWLATALLITVKVSQFCKGF